MREFGEGFVRVRSVVDGEAVRAGEARAEGRRGAVRVHGVRDLCGQTEEFYRERRMHPSVRPRPKRARHLVRLSPRAALRQSALLQPLLRQLPQHCRSLLQSRRRRRQVFFISFKNVSQLKLRDAN